MTFRTTLRDKCSSRQISLIGLPREKYARRILAIVSTTSIPIAASQNLEASVDPTRRGPDWMKITPVAGSLFHERTQILAYNVLLDQPVAARTAGLRRIFLNY